MCACGSARVRLVIEMRQFCARIALIGQKKIENGQKFRVAEIPRSTAEPLRPCQERGGVLRRQRKIEQSDSSNFSLFFFFLWPVKGMRATLLSTGLRK